MLTPTLIYWRMILAAGTLAGVACQEPVRTETYAEALGSVRPICDGGVSQVQAVRRSAPADGCPPCAPADGSGPRGRLARGDPAATAA